MSVFCGTCRKPCWSESTPAMSVTGSDVIVSEVIAVWAPVTPRSTSGVGSATMRWAVRTAAELLSRKSTSRLTSMRTATFACSTLW